MRFHTKLSGVQERSTVCWDQDCWNLLTRRASNYELLKAGLFAERQKPVPLIYEEVKLVCVYRTDLVVEKKVIIEVKAVEALNEIHLMQTLTHIKLLDFRLGMLINFNVLRLPEGIKRIANNLN